MQSYFDGQPQSHTCMNFYASSYYMQFENLYARITPLYYGYTKVTVTLAIIFGHGAVTLGTAL